MKSSINIRIFAFILMQSVFCCDIIPIKDIKKNNATTNTDTNPDWPKLIGYITENNIINWQLVGSTDVSNFEHKYVLRASLNIESTNTLDSVVADNTLKDSVQSKMVLLEYFTGHKCGNCPPTTTPIFSSIEATYGKKVHIMKIHTGFFSVFNVNATKYTYDFTSAIGNEIATSYDITSVPIGAINKKSFPNIGRLLSPTAWTSQISEELALKNDYGLYETHTFDANTKELQTQAKVKDLSSGKIYQINFKAKLNTNWNSQNCYLVYVLVDSSGTALQSMQKKL